MKIFFVTDIHASNVCYRKFLNALKIYDVDVGILLGDLTGKMLIPLVEKGIADGDLAALQGRGYIEYDHGQPQQALIEVSAYVKSLKLRRQEQEKTLLIAGGILAFLLLLSGGEK